MARIGALDTVVGVTLRNVFHALMSGTRTADEPIGDAVSGALEDAGMGEVSPEIVETALTHYADTAPLAEADVLAPLVTAVSHVPFDPDVDDLPSTDVTDDERMLDVEFDDLAEEVGADTDAGDHDVDPMDGFDAATSDTEHVETERVGEADENTGHAAGANSAVAHEAIDPAVSDFGAGGEAAAPAGTPTSIDLDVSVATEPIGMEDPAATLHEFDGFSESREDAQVYESAVDEADTSDEVFEDDFDDLPAWDE